METDYERQLKIVTSHVQQLAEHFDTVQIFVTRHEGDGNGPLRMDSGSGNFYGRFGQIACWIDKKHSEEMNTG